MTPGGAEALKATIRRALPLVAVLVVLGVVAVNTLRQLEGARYSASARVLIAETDLGAILTGTQPPYVDPDRIEGQELALASSPELYRRTAQLVPELGDPDQLASEVSVDGENGIFIFTASTSDPKRAEQASNAVAEEFIRWRAELSSEKIREAQRLLREQIATSGPTPELRQQLSQLEVLETLNSRNATLYQRAEEAAKTNPAPVRDTVLGGAIGMIVALLVVAAREAFNTRVRTEAEVEEMLDGPVLATIQSLPRRARLVMYGRHEVTYADTYALLAANLMQLRSSSGERLLAITSAISSEGKTSTAANLAVALARRGANVILADFDVRRPSVASLFNIDEQAPGVIQAATSGAPIEQLFWSVPVTVSGPDRLRQELPQATNGSGEQGEQVEAAAGGGSLLVLPAGGSLSAAELVRAKGLPKLFEKLRASADIVILDTPPALITAEMTELSRNVDLVLVVVRHGRATRRHLEALRRLSATWSSRFVGAVLTDVTGEDRSYYGTGYGR